MQILQSFVRKSGQDFYTYGVMAKNCDSINFHNKYKDEETGLFTAFFADS